MKYGIEVLVSERGKPKTWERVRPTGGQPYEYATREEAQNIAQLCYDYDSSSVRVVEVS